MILALRIACLALVLRSRAALLPPVNFTVTLTPTDIGLDVGFVSDTGSESSYFNCYDNNTLPSAAWSSYDGVTCSTTLVNQTFKVEYWGTWVALEGNTNERGSVAFLNGTTLKKEEIGRIGSTADDKQLYELWRQDSDYQGQKKVTGSVKGGRFTVSRARFGAWLRSQAEDFASTGRQTVFAAKNNSLNRAWSYSGNFDVSEPEGDLSFVSAHDSSSKVTVDVPANTSYVIATGFFPPGDLTAFICSFEPPIYNDLPLRSQPSFRKPGILMQAPLNPDIKYMVTISPYDASINSLTFFSSLSPIPDGYTAMGQDHIENLNYLTGPRDGDTGGGPSGDGSGNRSSSGSGDGGGNGGGTKKNLGSIVGGVVGGVVGAILIAGGVWWFLRRRRAKRKQSFKPFEIDQNGYTAGRDDADKVLVSQTSPITPYLHDTGQPAPATSYTPGEAEMKHQLYNQAGPAQQHQMRATDGGPAMLPPEYNSAWGGTQDGHGTFGPRQGQYDGFATPRAGPSPALLPEKQVYHDDDSDEDLK